LEMIHYQCVLQSLPANGSNLARPSEAEIGLADLQPNVGVQYCGFVRLSHVNQRREFNSLYSLGVSPVDSLKTR
jgi:hypothetical protein